MKEVTQSEGSHAEKDKYHMILLICGIQKNGTNELIYKTEMSHRCGEQSCGYQGESGGDKLGDWDRHIHTTLYKIDN